MAGFLPHLIETTQATKVVLLTRQGWKEILEKDRPVLIHLLESLGVLTAIIPAMMMIMAMMAVVATRTARREAVMLGKVRFREVPEVHRSRKGLVGVSTGHQAQAI